MSVIGYFVICGRCEIKMIVTVEARDSKHCPECLTELILEAIEAEDAAPQPDPVRQPMQTLRALLEDWEQELLGRNDDDDYPIGQVRG